MLLQPPVAAVIENAPVVERSILGSRAAECESRAVKKLRNEIGDNDILDVQTGSIGDTAHLVEEALGDELALLRHNSANHTLGIEQLYPTQLDLHILRFDFKEEADIFADVVTQQGSLLIAHLIRFSFEMEDPITVDFFKKPRAAACQRLGFSPRKRARYCEHNQQERRNLRRHPPHGLVSFFYPP